MGTAGQLDARFGVIEQGCERFDLNVLMHFYFNSSFNVQQNPDVTSTEQKMGTVH